MIARLAPSPTGDLHLGNAWAFLLTWLSARIQGGKIILRIDDIDPDRSKPQFVDGIIRDLRWLGLDYDQGPILQSERIRFYQNSIKYLHEKGLVYPCYCTRKELRNLATAPQIGDLGVIYPGTCRDLSPQARPQNTPYCLRLRFPEGDFSFKDQVYGYQSFTPNDLALQRSDGVIAYHLASVLDDGLMGVTEIVRGQDILSSTPWQLAIYHVLGFQPPTYAHVPLLCDAQGKRLAKRHQSLSLLSLRESGILPESIIGYLAFKAGILEDYESINPYNLLSLFYLPQLYRLNIPKILLEPETELMTILHFI